MKQVAAVVVGMVLGGGAAIVGFAGDIDVALFGGIMAVALTQRIALRQRRGSPAWRRFRRHVIASQAAPLFALRMLVGLAGVALLTGPRSAEAVLVVLFGATSIVVGAAHRAYGRAFRSDILIAGDPDVDADLDVWRWFDSTSRPFALASRRLRDATKSVEPVLWASALAAVLTDTTGVLTTVAAIAAGLAAVTLLVELAKIVTAVRRKVFERKRRITLAAIERHAPEAVVYFSVPSARSLYQLAQWIPTLEALDRPVAIITREAHLLRRLAALSERIPAIWVRRLADLEAAVPASTQLVFYVNNAQKNAHMVRRTDLTHVQLLHGESDKPSSATRASTAYDRLCVAGEAAIDRYWSQGIKLPREHFAIVGRPVTDVLHRGPTGNERPCVLYAPTWEGHDELANSSSIRPAIADVVRALVDRRGTRVIVKPHPLTGSRDHELRVVLAEVRETVEAAAARDPDVGHEYVGGRERSLYDCFDDADVLITDVSSVLADFLATERPMIVLDPNGVGPDALVRESPTTAGALIAPLDPAAVTAAIDDALGADTMRDERHKVRAYILGDFEGTATERFTAEVEAMFAARPPAPPADG